jgi:hypothetical protein
MELRQLQYFVAIAELESFRRAFGQARHRAARAERSDREAREQARPRPVRTRGTRCAADRSRASRPGRGNGERSRRPAPSLEARTGAEGAVGSFRIGYSRIFPFRQMAMAQPPRLAARNEPPSFSFASELADRIPVRLSLFCEWDLVEWYNEDRCRAMKFRNRFPALCRVDRQPDPGYDSCNPLVLVPILHDDCVPHARYPA